MNQNIIDKVFIRLHEKTELAVLNELTEKLTIEELKKLHKILAEASDYEWTKSFC